ncbi:MAG: prolyl oligopeptidase family serine peptidase [Pseudonocardia sp.]|nr:prolyl oligopeptidase family serine peptidase [Pseudonocardia sp.]
MSDPTPFGDVQDYLALGRLAGLELSPDGTRLVTTVSALDPDRSGRVTALWEIDPAGERAATRLTRSAKGESSAAFTPDGDLLFLSARPEGTTPDDAPAALWALPAGGGEAWQVGARPGGVAAPVVASAAGSVLVTSMTLPGAVTGEDDEARRKARRDGKVSAILHTAYPVRYWDHDLGPDEPRLLVGGPGEKITWTDLTPEPGAALVETVADLSPDGRTVVTAWKVPAPGGDVRSTIVAIDVGSGERRVLLADDGHDYAGPRISPDGSAVAVLRERRSEPGHGPVVDLVVVPLAGGDGAGGDVVVPTAAWDLWPGDFRWTPDSAALLVVADERGRAPLFRLALDGTTSRLTGDHGAYTDPRVSPDGATVYALRSAVDSPPTPVRLDAYTADQEPVGLRGPEEAPALPGTLTEIDTTAADGSPLRSWLVLPDGASATDPAPLLLWVHGGPLGSWNAWQWRWNPWLMAARGYAVLLPDPALSTGYGQAFVERGWGAWGAAPYTDLMTMTDHGESLPEIDATRVAAMGGSFGGYMANWIAGRTDRFAAIVTHASLWALDHFGTTTDFAAEWARELSPERAASNSPHHHVDAITTPMLVIHGDKDYRVPIGEGLRLWWELQSRQQDAAANPHRFLYFPDENHWILKPQNSVIWYETVFAFLSEHVLGKPVPFPDLLR